MFAAFLQFLLGRKYIYSIEGVLVLAKAIWSEKLLVLVISVSGDKQNNKRLDI
jgi:hypothetical protein